MAIITEPKINKYLYNILPKRDAVLAEREAYPQEHDISIIGPAVERMIHLLCNRSQRLQAGLEARRFDFLVSTRARAAYFCEILSGLRNLK